ncbi:MAG TPA: hypothetical protein VGB68_00640 [Pyrinomonadaceae bacterium]|jgi:hypothetical protein
MKSVVALFVFVLTCSSIAFGQELTRERKLQKIKDNARLIKQLTEEILLPDAKDFAEAKKNNFEVFRIMPREADIEELTPLRVAYYSFTLKANGYAIPEIGLVKNTFKVGFAGADYGFIADLGEMPLAGVSRETGAAIFLAGYKPPVNMPEIRSEQSKSRNYKAGDVEYRDSVPAIAGHTYVLRAITFDRADVLVALKVHRKDADGSLTVFWKLLEQFEKPLIARAE